MTFSKAFVAESKILLTRYLIIILYIFVHVSDNCMIQPLNNKILTSLKIALRLRIQMFAFTV